MALHKTCIRKYNAHLVVEEVWHNVFRAECALEELINTIVSKLVAVYFYIYSCTSIRGYYKARSINMSLLHVKQNEKVVWV